MIVGPGECQGRDKCAPRGLPSMPFSTRAIASLKSFEGPAQRAEKMPGAPSRESTQRPESSASAGSLVARVAANAFSFALPMKLSSVSSGSGRLSDAAEITSIAKGCSSSAISFALPWLWLARTSFGSVKRRGI
jgi:hypothetical protein